MPRQYSATGNRTNTAAKTVISLTSAATVRPRLFEFTLASDVTPADQAASYYLHRHTAAGTSTAFTPIGLDPAGPASLAATGFNHTVEPTLTASSYGYQFAANQRATFRWVAACGCEFVLPATAADNGISLVTNAVTSAFNVVATFLWAEYPFPARPVKVAGSLEINGKEVAETAQRCHCGNHFRIVRGSGTVRGFRPPLQLRDRRRLVLSHLRALRSEARTLQEGSPHPPLTPPVMPTWTADPTIDSPATDKEPAAGSLTATLKDDAGTVHYIASKRMKMDEESVAAFIAQCKAEYAAPSTIATAEQTLADEITSQLNS
ncbi:MAG: hypothetical protein JWN86_428 [Planctomycetota bacterium]|nr:hypothetical protein [Planctomycetota bacterium]